MSDKMRIALGSGGFILVLLLGILIYVYLNREDDSISLNNGQEVDLFNIEESEIPIVTDDSVLNNLTDEEEETMKEITDFEELEYKITKEGSGASAKEGDTVVVHYEGFLTDGTKFDSSYDRGEPFGFKLGERTVIQGWDEGVLGMKIGEIRQLRIPSSMGYGAEGAGGAIPPYAGLVFNVELLQIK